MTNIELYINNSLCDVSRDFSVRLNRQLINPGELNTKDAQYSYSVSLPPTPNNHAIFNYANVEETRDKFNRDYRAELIINSVRVFVGNFRLSEVSRTQYKGNLYVPAAKSVKDIFGELKMNENKPWVLPFTGFAASVGDYNTRARTAPQPAIFPFTLYGVLPKVLNSDGPDSDRDVWDDTVRLGMKNFPPSVNVMQLIRHVFESQGYHIGGTAFNDDRLTQLYMSYKNDPAYTQPWNYGRQARIHVRGAWSNYLNKRTNDTKVSPEKGVFAVSDGTPLYACDILGSTNADVQVAEDPGGNVIQSLNGEYALTQIMIPAAGFYKISFSANTRLPNEPQNNTRGPERIIGAYGDYAGFPYIRSAVKLLRDNGKGDFGVGSSRMDGVWDRDNMRQNADSVPRNVPHYYGGDVGTLNFVDFAQNKNYLAGFQWGRLTDADYNPSVGKAIDTALSQINAAKPAISWDSSNAGERLTRLAIANPVGYSRWDIPPDSTDDTPAWIHGTELYRIDLQHSPTNKSRRGYFDGTVAPPEFNAEGSVNCVVWLDKGELLTVADVSDRGLQSYEGVISEGWTWPHRERGWIAKEVTFDLQITPFRTDADWLKVDFRGNGMAAMDWDDDTNFATDSIDLVKFLPEDIKTDDFIDNFCKAFNLQLTQVDTSAFQLNVKQTRSAANSAYVNLDNLASVRDRSNLPLGIPSLYKLGFTVDKEEEGYITTGDDGGGEYSTGAVEGNVVEQKSIFSCNWFKEIRQGNALIPLAVISKHDVWDPIQMKYKDAMTKSYEGQALRFWYYDGLLPTPVIFNGQNLSVAKVSNELPGLCVLNYKNQRLTILQTYFTIFVNGGSHYTELEGYLTPVQYDALSGSADAIFNGDVYRVAELSGYDPLGRNKTKIRLIRT